MIGIVAFGTCFLLLSSVCAFLGHDNHLILVQKYHKHELRPTKAHSFRRKCVSREVTVGDKRAFDITWNVLFPAKTVETSDIIGLLNDDSADHFQKACSSLIQYKGVKRIVLKNVAKAKEVASKSVPLLEAQVSTLQDIPYYYPLILAQFYYYGLHVDRNHSKVHELAMQAINAGDAANDAYDYLGYCYKNGIGVTTNDAKAMRRLYYNRIFGIINAAMSMISRFSYKLLPSFV